MTNLLSDTNLMNLIQPKIYSYSRYSSDKQRKGTSLERQSQKIIDWMSYSGTKLELDTTLNMNDLAKSGWSAKNLESGAALATFIELIGQGRIAKGSILALEKIDRLTRISIDEATDLLKKIIRSGVDILTLDNNKLYTVESLKNIGDVIQIAIQMDLAHQESQGKSTRIQSAFEIKRKQMMEDNKPFYLNMPMWLTKDESTATGFGIIKERTKAIECLINKIADNGLTVGQVCKVMNEEGVHSYWRGNGEWKPEWVKTLFTKSSVIGEYYSEKHDIRKSMYPPIVSVDVFTKAKSFALSGKKRKRYSKHDTATFSGIIKCGYCGHSLNIRFKNKGHGQTKIYCSQNRYNKCHTHTVNYEPFKHSFLKYCAELDFTNIISPTEQVNKTTLLKDKLDGLKAQLDKLEGEYDSLVTFIRGSSGKAASKLTIELNKIIDEQEVIEGEIVVTESDFASSSSSIVDAHIISHTYKNLMKKMSDSDADSEGLRLRLTNHISSTVEKIVIYPRGVNGDSESTVYYMIEFKSGAKRGVEINSKTGEFISINELNDDGSLYRLTADSIDKHVDGLSDDEVQQAIREHEGK